MRMEEEGASETSVTTYGAKCFRNKKKAEPELLICIVVCIEFKFHHKILPAKDSDVNIY